MQEMLSQHDASQIDSMSMVYSVYQQRDCPWRRFHREGGKPEEILVIPTEDLIPRAARLECVRCETKLREDASSWFCTACNLGLFCASCTQQHKLECTSRATDQSDIEPDAAPDVAKEKEAIPLPDL